MIDLIETDSFLSLGVILNENLNVLKVTLLKSNSMFGLRIFPCSLASNELIFTLAPNILTACANDLSTRSLDPEVT